MPVRTGGTRSSITGVSPDAWDRWLWAWHIGFYALLALGTLAALADANATGGAWPRAIVLTLLFGGWYAVTVIRHPRWDQRPSMLIYVAGAMAFWYLLVGVHPAYFLLLFILYPQIFGILPLRFAIPSALILTALTAWRNIAEAGASAVPAAILTGILSSVLGILFALWIGAVIRQSRERRQLIEELDATRRDLAAAEREAGVLEERGRLAREIHDALAQSFTSIVMNLEAAEKTLPPGLTKPRRQLDQARSTARDGLAEARRLVRALRPELLEGASLPEALSRLAERWSDESGTPANTAVTGTQQPLPMQVEVTLLRAAQEALSNARKHARAGVVDVTLSYIDDLVMLDVQDDGAGFGAPPVSGEPGARNGDGFGLRAMRERVEQMGGRLLVESAPGDGTTLVVELPTTPEAGAEREPTEVEAP